MFAPPTLPFTRPAINAGSAFAAEFDAHWPREEPAPPRDFPEDWDAFTPLECDEDFTAALQDDDVEPLPEYGDFWQDADDDPE